MARWPNCGLSKSQQFFSIFLGLGSHRPQAGLLGLPGPARGLGKLQHSSCGGHLGLGKPWDLVWGPEARKKSPLLRDCFQEEVWAEAIYRLLLRSCLVMLKPFCARQDLGSPGS